MRFILACIGMAICMLGICIVESHIIISIIFMLLGFIFVYPYYIDWSRKERKYK